jgi:hypothetical protein
VKFKREKNNAGRFGIVEGGKTTKKQRKGKGAGGREGRERERGRLGIPKRDDRENQISTESEHGKQN